MKKTEVIPLVGTPDEFYKLLQEVRARKDHIVIEEFVTCQAVQMQAPKLNGIQQLQPQMGVLVSGMVVVEKVEILSQA